MNFIGLIKKWNGGIERGAKRRFAEAVGVQEASVGRWANGRGLPEEEIRPKVAKMLGVSVDQLMESFGVSAEKSPTQPIQANDFLRYFSNEEAEGLKKLCEKDMRDPIHEIRWLLNAYLDGDLLKVEDVRELLKNTVIGLHEAPHRPVQTGQVKEKLESRKKHF